MYDDYGDYGGYGGGADCGHEETCNEGGKTVCKLCGFVLDTNSLTLEVAFESSGGGGSTAVGKYIPATGRRNRAIMGVNSESREMTKQKARIELSGLAGELSLQPYQVECAVRLYERCLDHRCVHGRKSSTVLSACLYIVCRQQKKPQMLIDFSEYYQESVWGIAHTYLHVCRMLGLEVPRNEPTMYVERFVERLQVGSRAESRRIAETAMKIVARMERDWIQCGRRPAGIVAAALVVACRIHGCQRSCEEVVRMVRMHEDTLRRRLQELRMTSCGRLTVGMLAAPPGDADPNALVPVPEEEPKPALPPAFQRALREEKARLIEEERARAIADRPEAVQALPAPGGKRKRRRKPPPEEEPALICDAPGDGNPPAADAEAAPQPGRRKRQRRARAATPPPQQQQPEEAGTQAAPVAEPTSSVPEAAPAGASEAYSDAPAGPSAAEAPDAPQLHTQAAPVDPPPQAAPTAEDSEEAEGRRLEAAIEANAADVKNEDEEDDWERVGGFEAMELDAIAEVEDLLQLSEVKELEQLSASVATQESRLQAEREKQEALRSLGADAAAGLQEVYDEVLQEKEEQERALGTVETLSDTSEADFGDFIVTDPAELASRAQLWDELHLDFVTQQLERQAQRQKDAEERARTGRRGRGQRKRDENEIGMNDTAATATLKALRKRSSNNINYQVLEELLGESLAGFSDDATTAAAGPVEEEEATPSEVDFGDQLAVGDAVDDFMAGQGL